MAHSVGSWFLDPPRRCHTPATACRHTRGRNRPGRSPAVSEMSRQPIVALAAVLLSGLVFSLAAAIVGGYEAADGLAYTDHVDAAVVLRMMRQATWSGVAHEWPIGAGFLLSLGVALVATLATLRVPASQARLLAFGFSSLVFWPGWLCLWVLAGDLLIGLAGRQDGEWIAEYFPIMDAIGFWLAAATVVAVLELRVVWRGLGGTSMPSEFGSTRPDPARPPAPPRRRSPPPPPAPGRRGPSGPGGRSCPRRG